MGGDPKVACERNFAEFQGQRIGQYFHCILFTSLKQWVMKSWNILTRVIHEESLRTAGVVSINHWGHVPRGALPRHPCVNTPQGKVYVQVPFPF